MSQAGNREGKRAMVADPMVDFGRSAVAEDQLEEVRPTPPADTAHAGATTDEVEDHVAGGAAPLPRGAPGGGRQIARIGTRLDQLVQTIETDIVPRLLMAHAADVPADPEAAMPGPAEVAAFTALVLAEGVEALMATIDDYRARGVPLERIYLDLLAPTARRLGRMWEEDECDFATVTLGLQHLHGVLHACRTDFVLDRYPAEEERRALLSPVPGEDHLFGIAIVAEFLRNAGWDVTDAQAASRREIADLVNRRWFAVVGLSISSESRLDALTGCIRAIRKASCNPGIGVLVGGQVFCARPELVAVVGADAAAADGRSAVLQAERLRAHMAGMARH